MGRPPVADTTAIDEAIQSLIVVGTKPTVQLIRDAIGGGSYSTITAALRDWEAQQARQAPPPPIPDSVQARGAQLLQAVWSEATVLLNQQLDSVRAEAAKQIDAVQTAQTAAEAEIARLEAALIALTEQFNAQADLLGSTQQQLAAAQTTQQVAEARAAAQHDQILMLEQLLREEQQQHAATAQARDAAQAQAQAALIDKAGLEGEVRALRAQR